MKIYFLFESFAKDAKNMLLYIENLILVFKQILLNLTFSMSVLMKLLVWLEKLRILKNEKVEISIQLENWIRF